jgi:UDP-3-O-[3-hydroxymyristoyl] glucosamine N-acyltransferase
MPHPVSLQALAEALKGRILRGDPRLCLERVVPTDGLGENALTFVTRPKYLPALAASRARAVLISEPMVDKALGSVPPEMAILVVADAYVAMARASQRLAPPVPGPSDIHATAVVDPSAILEEGVRLGPHAVVGAGARIGARTVLYAGAHVESGASVGPDSRLYNHVVVGYDCWIGARCILHPGVVIGSDGFGFARDRSLTSEQGAVHVKIPQIGRVIVEDDVEIGANACVDRAALGETVVGAGTKIDNLVQIGHNARVGRNVLMVSQSGIAGSVILEDEVTLAGQAGVAGHLRVGARSTVAGQAGVGDDLPPDSWVIGFPATPLREWTMTRRRLRMLDSLFRRVKELAGGSGKADEGGDQTQH